MRPVSKEKDQMTAEEQFLNRVSESESMNKIISFDPDHHDFDQVFTPPSVIVFAVTTPPPSPPSSPPSTTKKGKGKGGKKSTKKEGKEYIELPTLSPPPSGSDHASTSGGPPSRNVSIPVDEESSFGGEENSDGVPLNVVNASIPPAQGEISVRPPHHHVPTLEVILFQVLILIVHGLSIAYYGCRYL